jgi:amino acid adenylation domain-containing protein
VTASELLTTLKAQGIALWFEGERLRFRAPKGALTDALRVELAARRSEIVAALRAAAAAEETVCPPSFSQQALWFVHQQAPDSTAYHVAMPLRVLSPIDVAALRQALQALVDRHATLRTTFDLVDGALSQRIAGHAAVCLELHGMHGAGEAELRAAVEADFRRPFDLASGPVLRATLFSRAPDDHVLLLVVHHIAVDGWSLLLLIEEMLKLYAEAAGGAPAGLARPEVGYADYARWQEQAIAGPEGERMWSYWRDTLAAPRAQADLPLDHPRPPIQNFRGATLPLQLDPALTARIKDLARAAGTTPFVVLLASFQILLFRLTGSGDVITGTPVFARPRAEFMRVIGDFVNSIAVRSRLAATMSFREAIAALRQTMLAALDAQDYPLSLLVQRLQPERAAGRAPLFDTFFILQRFEQFRDIEQLLAGDGSGEPLTLAGLRFVSYPLRQLEGQFDLALHMVERDGAFHGAFSYRTDVFEETTVARIAGDYAALVATLAETPDAALTAPRPDVAALIDELKARDVKLALDGDRLRVNAPKGAFDDALKASLAAHRDEVIAALRASAAAREGGGFRAIARSGPLPLSAAQRRLWFLDRMEPGRADYNIGVGLRLRGPLDRDLLRRAIDGLIARHESLRTRFLSPDGTPVVEIAETGETVLDWIDLTATEPVLREAEAQRLGDDWLRRPFDLTRGPLSVYRVLRFGVEDHLLIISMHHAISDGWSLMTAMREICEVYDALAQGRAPRLGPLPLHAVDHAAWEQEQLRRGGFARELAYWKQKLAGAPAVLELPTDRHRPAAQSFRGARLRCWLDAALLDALKARSRAQDATLFMTVLAAWQVLLHRWSGQDDIVVGSAVANRSVPALEGLIGCLVNNMALRANLAGNPTFAEVLAQVKETTLSALAQATLPFDQLVEGLNPVRSASHAPVFQVLFTLMSFPIHFTAPKGFTAEFVESDTHASRFDLAIELVEHEGRLGALYEFATDLFDEVTIRRLHARFACLLQTVAADPAVRIDDLPLLTAEEQKLLLGDWNATALDHDRGRCLHHLLDATARDHPSAPAVTAGDVTLSYGELDARANRLAHLLRARGVDRGALVAVLIDRSADMPAVLAAVLKAGAAYVPLDPAHPAERLRTTAADAGVACVVTSRAHAPLIADCGAPLLLLDEAEDALAAMPATAPEVTVRPQDLAYVIYTSGSTGKPKGVEVEHRNVVSFITAMQRAPGFASDDVLLAVTTLSFDIAGLELWLPLAAGGRIVIASRADSIDGERLIALIAAHGVTMLQATPATFRLLLDAGFAGKRDLTALCGGEALPRDLATALLPRVGALWNMYGPTETTIWSTAARITDPAAGCPIGQPIANTRVYVLENGAPAPIGVVGELCIGGEGVARGYRNRPDLTAEKFVTLPLPDGRAERIYRTGDMARFRSNGELEFLGRRDHQVKIRGHRIELGEIETILATHPGIRQCVVAAREDAPGDQRLVGYVVTAPAATFDAEAARGTLRHTLPDYMIPNAFVVLDALPLTANGKIDRKALPPPMAQPAPPRDDVAAALMTPAQRRIVAIWRDVLRLDRVGLTDNFFDLGGHSLLLVKVHAGLKREFGADIAMVELFQHTTVAAQAERVAAATREASRADHALQRARARAVRQHHG